MKSMASVIAEVPLFKEMRPEYVELLSGCASNTKFDAGEYIYRQGEPADRFYVIRHGRVSQELFVPQRGPLTVRTVKEGEILGWAWLIPPYERQLDARAIVLTRALAIDGACLRGKCEQDPRLGYELMQMFAQVMVKTLQAARLQIMDVYGSPSPD